MRTRHLLVAPLIAGLALLSACGGSDGGTSDAHTKAYLQVVKSSGATFADDDAAIAAGKQACSDLGSGKSMIELVDSMSGQAGGQAQAAAVVGAAISSFCPDQTTKVMPGK